MYIPGLVLKGLIPFQVENFDRGTETLNKAETVKNTLIMGKRSFLTQFMLEAKRLSSCEL